MIVPERIYMPYMRVPFELGGRDKTGMDCWGLYKALSADCGVQVPDYLTPESNVSISLLIGQELSRVFEPTEDHPGALVHISIPMLMSHVGFSLGNGRFVHIWQGSNSVECQDVADWNKRIKGYYRFVG